MVWVNSENSSIFSLIRMCLLLSARACGQLNFTATNPPVLNWGRRLTQLHLYNGCKMVVCSLIWDTTEPWSNCRNTAVAVDVLPVSKTQNFWNLRSSYFTARCPFYHQPSSAKAAKNVIPQCTMKTQEKERQMLLTRWKPIHATCIDDSVSYTHRLWNVQ